MRHHRFGADKVNDWGISNSRIFRNALFAFLFLGTFILGVWTSTAQTVLIEARCLTPAEKKAYASTTQLSGGTVNVGIGQPLYLNAMITKGTVVTQVNWTLLNKPQGSTATFSVNLFTNNAYDSGDQASYDVVSRTNLVPDVPCIVRISSTQTIYEAYTVKATFYLTNKTLSVTNSFYGATYLGFNAADPDSFCAICHVDKISAFEQTDHDTALMRKIDGSDGAGFKLSCVSCHSVGYDTTAGATNGGFDDVMTQVGWTFPTNLGMTNMLMLPPGWNYSSNLVMTNMAATNWDSMPLALQDKGNIQCECCHGAASRHMRGAGDTNAITVSLSAGDCAQCHDSPTGHIKVYQWSQTLHASPVGFHTSGSCQPCHTAKGFIANHDADYAATEQRSTLKEGITCATCHDPHSVGMGDYQLRSMPSVTFSNGVVLTRGGEGLLCMNCHHDRNNANTQVLTKSGPHHGTQGDMLAGINAVEYGMSMPSSPHLDVVSNSCVGCHMQPTSTNALAINHVGEHTFKIRQYLQGSLFDSSTPPNGTTDVLLTGTCAGCHGAITNFNVIGEDYDQDGVVQGVQTEITNMMYQLAKMLPPYSGTNIDTSSFTTNAADYNKRAAAYNWNFVREDGSMGVHNAKYAAAILRASIDVLRVGFVDVNHDGLPDTWQIANFGSISNPNAAPGADPDHDGLTNLQEWQAGTNPNSSDSDSDGFSDLVELQAGSDPLNLASTPDTNSVSILPAIELAYTPGTLGMTQQFQVVSSLTGGSWTNMGTNFVSAPTQFYQLWSLRNTTNEFFRVKSVP